MFFDRKKTYKRIDYLFIAVVLALIIYGFIIIKSATSSYTEAKQINYLRQQGLATVLGIIMMIVIMLTPPEIMKKLAWPIYIMSTGLLLITLIFGSEQNYSKSWLQIGSFQFQPAEVVKIGIIISLASFLEKDNEKINEPFTLIKLLILAFIPVFLILKQPDFGTAVVYAGIIAVMFFSSGISFKYIILAISAVILYIPVYWYKLNGYAKNRFFDFLNPERDITGSGLQLYLGKMAISSGKFRGRGLFKGIQNQNNYIPLKHSDYIFTVLGEELGLFGGIILFSLYFIMLYKMIKIARNGDSYSKALISGIVSMFMIHIWENCAMTMNLMPATGIPLPFISAAGTFQLANLVSIGLVLGIKYHGEVFTSARGRKIDNLLTNK